VVLGCGGDEKDKTPDWVPPAHRVGAYLFTDEAVDLDLHPGLQAKVVEIAMGTIYDAAKAAYASASLEWDATQEYLIERIDDLPAALDPYTGDLYFIGRIVESATVTITPPAQVGGKPTIEWSRTYRKEGETDDEYPLWSLDLTTGEITYVKEAKGGLSIAFDDFGNLYFSVGQAAIAKWVRRKNEFKTLAQVPSIEALAYRDGALYAVQSAYGGQGDFPNHLIKIDPDSGEVESVMSPSDIDKAIPGFEVGSGSPETLGIDADGSLHVGYYSSGAVVVKSKTGIALGNSRHVAIGGVHKSGFGYAAGTLYQHDGPGGLLFALGPGREVLIGTGKELTSEVINHSMVASDDNYAFVSANRRKIIAIFAAQAGKTLTSVLDADNGTGDLVVSVNDANGQPAMGAEVSLPNLHKTTNADTSGKATFKGIAIGLYEFRAKYGTWSLDWGLTTVVTGSTSADANVSDGMPGGWLKKGESAFAYPLEVSVWATPDHGVAGTGDVRTDKNGDVYAMNAGNSTITKHKMNSDGTKGDDVLIATGGDLGNAWTVLIDDAMNVYTSNGNNGVMKIAGEGIELTVDKDDARKVTNQAGKSVVLNLVRDVDGLAMLKDGTLVMGSGSGGGGATECHSNGTEDTILSQDPKDSTTCPKVISNGTPLEGLVPESTRQKDSTDDEGFVIRNPDVLRVDLDDKIWITNKGGYVSRIIATGADAGKVDWWMRADGFGNLNHYSGSYACSVPDPTGKVFLRGKRRFADSDKEDFVIRVFDPGVSPSVVKYYQLVSGLHQDFSGLAFVRYDATHGPETGKAIIISDGPVLVRVAVHKDYAGSLFDFAVEHGSPE
jgi:hypothetical protein